MNLKKIAIYARVSTQHQSVGHQLDPLLPFAKSRGYEIFETYIDQSESGASKSRPQLDRLMDDARKRKFDAVLVWKFDRFARSVGQLSLALDEFNHLGIEFLSFTENIDTSSPMGQAMFSVIGAMAQLERDLLVERIKSGMEKAARDGKKIGRPTSRLPGQVRQAIIDNSKKLGLSVRQLAEKHNTNKTAVHRLLKSASSIG